MTQAGGISIMQMPEWAMRARAQSKLSNKTTDQELFSQVISRAQSNKEETPEARARAAAEQLVATALVQPVLKQLRESNHAEAPFAPNAAERSFRSLMDAGLAQRMVTSQHWGLVDNLARGMLKKMGQDTAAGPPRAASSSS